MRYDQVNAMLLNEFLEEHGKVQKLEATMAQLQKHFDSKLAEQRQQIDALTLAVQKVSAKVEMSHPVPQVVASNR